MYNDFYGFTEKPFNIVPNPDLFYPSRKHSMALTYLEYGLVEGAGFVVFTGEIGTGKTTLIRHLLSKIDEFIEVAVLFNTNVGPEDLIRLILLEFEVEPAGKDKSSNLDRLNEFLIEKYAENRKCLLIVDEAQNLSREALEEVRMLSNIQTETASLIQIALVGQPELRDKLRHPSLAQLKQRVTVSYHLGVMSRSETGEYITHRLNKVAAKNPELFTGYAVDLIHEKSGGVPRMINILCDASLVYGFADEAKTITRDIVEQVVADREEHSAGEPVATDKSVEAVPERSGNGFYAERLSALEARVNKLQTMLDAHETEIQERMDSGRDKLVSELEKLLAEERKRSEKLLEECVRYRNKAEYKRKVADKCQLTIESDPKPEEKAAPSEKSRSRWRKWFNPETRDIYDD